MIVVKRRLYGRGIFSGIGGIKRRTIVDHADIGYNHFHVVRLYDVTNQILDLGDVLIRNLDASAGRHFHIDGELPGIGLREKGEPQDRINRQAQYKQTEQGRHGEPGNMVRRPQESLPGVHASTPGSITCSLMCWISTSARFVSH